MDSETDELIARWILAFCEPPPPVDADLMRQVLAEHEARPYGRNGGGLSGA